MLPNVNSGMVAGSDAGSAYLGGLQNPVAAYLNDLYGWVDELDTLANIQASTVNDLSLQTAQLIYWSDFVDQDLDYLFAWITSHVQQENAALGDIWTAINTLDGDITTLFANDQTLSGRIAQRKASIRTARREHGSTRCRGRP